jgi:hypothetical protein
MHIKLLSKNLKLRDFLGAVCVHFGAVCVHLGAVCVRLGAVCVRLGAVLNFLFKKHIHC